jgi:integrase/recombinase XerD
MLPALPDPGQTTDKLNPAISYLRDLPSRMSRRAMVSTLNCTARILGATSIYDCNWGLLRREAVSWTLDVLQEMDYAPATINTYRSAIRGVAREAWLAGLMTAEDFERIKLVKSARGRRLPKGRSLSSQEVRMLLDLPGGSTAGSMIDVRDAAVVAVFVGAGLRRAEVAGLDLDDVDFRDRSLIVRGKGNKERMAFLPDGLWAYVEKWVEFRGDFTGPLFIRIRRHESLTTDRLSTSGIYHVVDSRRQIAGVDYFSPHDLRRTFATRMLDLGMDLFTVKDAMGHENLATTQRYDKRSIDKQKSARDRFNYDS